MAGIPGQSLFSTDQDLQRKALINLYLRSRSMILSKFLSMGTFEYIAARMLKYSTLVLGLAVGE